MEQLARYVVPESMEKSIEDKLFPKEGYIEGIPSPIGMMWRLKNLDSVVDARLNDKILYEITFVSEAHRLLFLMKYS